MTSRSARAAAAALAAVALVPWPGRADTLERVERELAAVEQRMGVLEAQAARPDESPAMRAARKLSDGETQYLLGDWHHAALLLSAAVEEPAFRESAAYPAAVFYLADALRRQGSCSAASPYYDALLALPSAPHRGEALAGAIACAVAERRPDRVDALLPEAERVSGGAPPAEVRYLAAKSLFLRTDLAPEEREARTLAALAAVPPPYLQQAAYLHGVLHLERKDLEGALVRFEACHAAAAVDPRQREVQDLCALALGRVTAELGRPADAVDWYQRVPRESPHFEDALYETAWVFVKAGQDDAALRVAAMISDLAPESPLAPEATVLQGHLHLRLGRYAAATEAYSRVINAYAPVRDEIDAILGMHDDPVAYFDELIGRQGSAFDVATVLPPVALRWAGTRKDLSDSLRMVSELDAARRQLDEATALADRIDALLTRGDGVDAFPVLRGLLADAHALENHGAVLEARAVDAAVAAAGAALAPEVRARVAEGAAARAALRAPVEALPRTAEDVRAREARMHARVAVLEGEAFRLGYQIAGLHAAIGGAERWLERHRAELSVDPEERAQVGDELREHRAVVALYDEALVGVRRDLALARDAAGATEALKEEAALRARLHDALRAEREALEAARSGLPAQAIAALDRAAAVAARAAALRERSRALGERLAAAAQGRAGALRERVSAERRAAAEAVAVLEGIQGDARDVVGRIAYRAFRQVGAQFYQLVLKADVGLVDVAWSRKRARLDRIQQLSLQKATELRQLDLDYRGLLREVE